MTKLHKKLLAMVLSISIVLTCIPMTTFAIGSTTDNIDNTIVNNQTQEATIVTEVTEKRDADKKVYLLSDGSYMSAIYPQQVHYEENGKWEDIDNSFASGVDDDGESTVENSKNAFKIKFANKAKDKKLVSLKKDSYEINWALNDSKKVTVETIVSDNSLNTAASLKNINGAVAYKDILTDTDLKYTINSTTIKEDIILNSINAPTTFTFNYEMKKLAYRETEDGSIEVYSNNEPDKAVFVIDKPYMYDANGISSNSVEMKITETKKGFQIVIIPNAEWIKSAERKFPITIDPTIYTEQSASSIKDTTGVLSDKTDQLYNALEANSNYLWLKVGRFYGTQAYSLIYVPLPTNISESCRIIDAKLNVISYRAGISTASSNLTISAHEITSDWNQNTISENKILYGDEVPEYDYFAADFMVLNDASANSHNQLYSFDITKIAQKWATGESVNRGILLEGQDLPSTERYMRFYDSDNSVRNSDPCFTYTYRDTKGIEDYWTYTTMSAGRSGTAAVNNFNGNLVVTQNITGIAGNRLPVSISAIYDSSSRTSNSYNIGNGWRTNYDMRICSSSIEGFPYYLIDSDGTEHYFYGETTDPEWKDEDGLGYVLKKDSSVSANGYLLTDKGKNKTYFRSDGKLIRMDDTLGNHIYINYNTSSKIATIIDGANRTYTFNYNSNGLIASISNPANKVVSFIYDGNNLSKITYSDGKSTSFSYGTYGLSRITNCDNTYTSFNYNYVANHLYVLSLEFYGSNNILNTDYDFVYQHNNTIVTSNKDNTVNHTYQFDNYGKTVGVINNIDRTGEYYEYGAPGGNATGNENKLLGVSNTIQSSFSYYNDNDTYSNSSKWYVDPEATDTTMTIDNSKGRNSSPSLKLSQNNEYGGYSAVIYDVGVLKGGYNYDFSAYINTNGVAVDTPYGISVSVYYYDSNDGYNSYGSLAGSINSTFEDDWIYSNSQLGFAEDQHCYVVIGAYFNSPGSFWIDDLQINLGDGIGQYNYVSDNVYQHSDTTWQYRRNGALSNDDSVAFYTDVFVCTIRGAFNEKRSVSQVINCKGNAGDTLVFGAWSVAHSVPTNVTKTGSAGKSTYRLRLEMSGPSGNATFTNDSNILNYNYALEEWQLASDKIIAPIDFTSVTLYFDYDYNDTFAMMREPFVYKENFGQSYTYDSNGNIVSSKDLAESEATFAYQNNNLTQMINPTGTRYSYAYDEETNLLEYANSSNGQLFSFVYDQYGNVLASSTTAYNNAVNLETSVEYYIRNSTTGNAMKNNGSSLVNGTYATQNNTIRWKLISAGETDVYYIQPANDSTKYLTVKDNSSSDKVQIILSSINNSDSQKFKIESNNDGSFKILTKSSNFTKAIDSRDLNNNSSTELNKNMVQNTIDTTSGYQKWFFEKYSIDTPEEKIVNSATYTADGNYVSTETDSLGNTTSYTYNSDGTTNNITDSKNVVTSYLYDNSGNLSSVTSANTTNSYTYENDQIKTITTSNGTVYTFNYDAYGRNTSIDLNRVNSTSASRRLVTYDYNLENYVENFTFGSSNNIYSVTYGNGHSYNLTYSTSGLLQGKGSAWYFYDKNGNIVSKSPGGDFINYYRDLSGRIINKTMSAEFDGSIIYSLNYKYLNQKNLLDKYRFTSGSTNLLTSFIYGDINNNQIADAVYGVKLNNTLRLGYNYDTFGRQNSRTLYVGNGINKTYSYITNGNNSSYLIDTVNENGYTYTYGYDSLGNITSYTKVNNSNNQILENYIYRYDDKCQLIYAGTSETNGIEYTYDSNGNILTKKDLSTNQTISYGYNDATWADLLTSYNGQTITYDEIGNPLVYRNGMNFSWINGRNLESVTKNGSTYYYYYDEEGNRVSKSVGDVYTQFMVFDSVMYGERRYDSNGETVIYYYYDDSGNKYGFSYNGTDYFYQFNLQGDVIGIYDTSGSLVVEYKYDDWGKVLSITGSLASTVGNINPIRYRSYYYDNETGLYHLQSRYYDPEIGRFVNSDGQINDDILGTNLFAYCGNNPIIRADDDGEGWWIVAGAIVGGIVGGVTKAVSNVATGKKWNDGIIGSIAGGAVAGAIITATGGTAWATAGTYLAAFGGAAVESISNEAISYTPGLSKWNGQEYTKKATKNNIVNSTKTVIKDTAINGVSSLVTGKLAVKAIPINEGWFKPQKFVSSFAGKYAVKSELQSLVQGGLDFCSNGIQYSIKQRFKQGQQTSISFFPNTQIRAAG